MYAFAPERQPSSEHLAQNYAQRPYVRALVHFVSKRARRGPARVRGEPQSRQSRASNLYAENGPFEPAQIPYDRAIFRARRNDEIPNAAMIVMNTTDIVSRGNPFGSR